MPDVSHHEGDPVLSAAAAGRPAAAGRGRRVPWARLLLAVLALLLVCLPYQFGTTRRLDVGSEAAATGISGFSFVEADAAGVPYRWSGGEATVRFDGVGNAPLRLRLLLQARRPVGTATVHVLANGREVAALVVGGDFAEHVVAVPRAAAGWSGRIDVTLRTETFTAPPDTRALGTAVSWVSLEAAGWPVLPPLPLLAPLLLTVVAASLWRPGGRAAYARGAVLALCVAVAVLAHSRWQAVGDWLWLLPVAAWLALAIGWWGPAAVRGIRRWRLWARGRSRRFWIVAIVVASLLLYIPLSWTTGYWGDIEIYMAWTHQITHYGIHAAYSPDFVAPPNTTPVLLYPFRLAGEVFRLLWSPDFPPPWEVRTDQQYLRFLLRLPALAATAAIAAVLYLYVKRRWRRLHSGDGGDAVALLVAAVYLFNPAVVFESAYYGQMGAVHTLFMLLAVIGVVEGWPAWGWAALTVGMLTKPQADVFAPLLLLLTWQRYGWKGLLRSALAVVATALVILAPFLYYGTLGEMWERVSRVTAYHPILSATAHNLWWLVSLGQGSASDLATLPFLANLGFGFINFRLIGLGLFALAYLLVLARAALTPRGQSSALPHVPLTEGEGASSYAIGAYLFLAFFILPTQIHENHLIPMFPLLLLAVVFDRRRGLSFYGALYLLFAVTTTANMALHYPQILRVLVPQNPDIWGGSELALPRLLDSAVQVGAFAWWTVVLARETVGRWRER
ncbi:MAG: hypothetical protein ACYC5O_14260 [Anaerolineae bacterium]